jgi:photosystem II stability/assembly factor-like uncharacterized protein
MKMNHYIYVTIAISLLFCQCLQAQTVTTLQENKSSSIRGLSIVDDKVAWVSGNNGTIGITTDGGKNWQWQQVKGFEKSDFRDIEAFSKSEAVIMSSGTPALILKTNNGGTNWRVNYQKADTSYFLDAMTFTDNLHGWVLGDPIADKFLLLTTDDGGETWQPVKYAPIALKGEGAFAASGTCLSVSKLITIVTGGTSSRILTSTNNHLKWNSTVLPLTNGSPSRGAFSVAYSNNQTIIVGGDYANNQKKDSVAYLLPKPNALYQKPKPLVGPAGFQSCIVYIKRGTFLSTGTSGSNITTDDGKTWRQIDTVSYNVCSNSKNGKLILLAGDKGKIGLLKM